MCVFVRNTLSCWKGSCRQCVAVPWRVVLVYMVVWVEGFCLASQQSIDQRLIDRFIIIHIITTCPSLFMCSFNIRAQLYAVNQCSTGGSWSEPFTVFRCIYSCCSLEQIKKKKITDKPKKKVGCQSRAWVSRESFPQWQQGMGNLFYFLFPLQQWCYLIT